VFWAMSEEEEEEQEAEEAEEMVLRIPQAALAVVFLNRIRQILRRRAVRVRRLPPVRPTPIEEIPFEEMRRRREVLEGYRCPYCGGPVNTLTGRCQACGAKVW